MMAILFWPTVIFVVLMPFSCSALFLGSLSIWHDVFEVDRIFVDDEAGGLSATPISNAIMGF